MATKSMFTEIDNYEVQDGGNRFHIGFWDFSGGFLNPREIVSTVAGISVGNFTIQRDISDKLLTLGHESPFEFVSIVDINKNFVKRITMRHKDWFLIRDRMLFEYGEDELKQLNQKYIYTFFLKIPLFVARQIMRHRTFSYMELSRRYVKNKKVPFEFYVIDDLVGYYHDVVDLYERLVTSDVSPEDARTVIPVSLYTYLWMQGDYRSFANFFVYRTHISAQRQTRSVASGMLTLLKKHDLINPMVSYIENEFVNENNFIFREARLKYINSFLRLIEDL